MSHSHILYDSDPHFRIDPISRNIINESNTKTKIVQHDHNSERFTFEIPRYIDGHDMSSCNIVEIHYLNVESNTKIVRAGVYTVDDLHIKADDEDTVVCSWLVPNNATQFVGQLQFLVRFACVHGDAGRVEYVWNTAVYSGITVSSGIYNSDSPSDNPAPPFNFVTTINGLTLKFFVGTREEYNALSIEDKQGLFAMITDDTTKSDFYEAIAELQDKYNELSNGDVDALRESIEMGMVTIPQAEYATNADKATHDSSGNPIKKTYGNFAKEWTNTPLFGDKVSLDGEGTYLFKVNISDPDDLSFVSSAMVYFNGTSETICMLNFHQNVHNKVFQTTAYRLKISIENSTENSTDAIATIERSYNGSVFVDWTKVTTDIMEQRSVSISYKKIL